MTLGLYRVSDLRSRKTTTLRAALKLALRRGQWRRTDRHQCFPGGRFSATSRRTTLSHQANTAPARCARDCEPQRRCVVRARDRRGGGGGAARATRRRGPRARGSFQLRGTKTRRVSFVPIVTDPLAAPLCSCRRRYAEGETPLSSRRVTCAMTYVACKATGCATSRVSSLKTRVQGPGAPQ